MGDSQVDEIIAQWRASARPDAEVPEASIGKGERARWGRRRWVAGGIGALLALVLAAVLMGGQRNGGSEVGGAGGVAEAGADGAPAADAGLGGPAPAAQGSASGDAGPVAADPPMADDWYAVLSAVDDARRRAYGTQDGTALSEAFDEGGPGIARELDLVDRLRRDGLSAHGWSTELMAVSPVAVTESSATLRVIDRRGPYSLVGPKGQTEVPASDPAAWLVEFRRVDGRWLVFDTAPEPMPALTSPSGPS